MEPLTAEREVLLNLLRESNNRLTSMVDHREGYFMIGEIRCSTRLEDKDVQVLECYATEDCKMEEHEHLQSRELFILITGHVTINSEGKDMELEVGKGFGIDAGISHSCTCKKGSRFLTICIPPEKIYSN